MAPRPMRPFVQVWPRYEVSLLMNACADIYEDDLTALVDGEDQMQGNTKGDLIKEAYSFQAAQTTP